MALNDRETHYEAQIKEYQTKRDQAAHETDNLRSELAKLHDEFEKQSQSSKVQLEDLQNQSSIFPLFDHPHPHPISVRSCETS